MSRSVVGASRRRQSPVFDRTDAQSVPGAELELNVCSDTPKLSAACSGLRTDLQQRRDELWNIHDCETNILKEYRSAEVRRYNILHKIGGSLRSGKSKKQVADLLEELLQRSRANDGFRERIVTTDHSLSFRVREAQKKVSDERFKLTVGEKNEWELVEQLDRLKVHAQDVNNLMLTIRTEIVTFTVTKKDLSREIKRQVETLEDQRLEFDGLSGLYVELTQRFDELSHDRKERDDVLDVSLVEHKVVREERTRELAQAKSEREMAEARLAKLQGIVGDMTYKRERLDDELRQLRALAKRRNEQCAEFAAMVDPK